MNRLYKLRSFGCAEVSGYIWFPNRYFNALIKMNKASGQIQLVSKFPNYGVRQYDLYTTVCYVDGKLIFIPGHSEEILSYDIKTGKYISVKLNAQKIGKDKLYFWNAYVYHKYVYMFPRKAKCIVRYDALENSVKYLENSLNKIISSFPEGTPCFVGQFEILDGKIYMPFEKINAVAVFDLEDENVDIRYLDIEGGCSTINYVDGNFYLASCSFPIIYQWDKEENNIKKYDAFPEEFEILEGFSTGEIIFGGACCKERKLLFLPIHGNMLVSFDIDTGKIKKEKKFKKGIDGFMTYGNGDVDYALIEDKGRLCFLKYEEGKVSMDICYVENELYLRKQISDFLLKNKYYEVYIEGKNDFESYIEILRDTDRKVEVKRKERCGNLILNRFL